MLSRLPCLTEQAALLVACVRNLLLLLAPVAPHISEELWHQTGFAGQSGKSIHVSDWPGFIEELTIDSEIELVLQVNGRIVSKVNAPRGLAKAEAEEIALGDSKIQGKLNGQKVRKLIFVPDKLVNVVI